MRFGDLEVRQRPLRGSLGQGCESGTMSSSPENGIGPRCALEERHTFPGTFTRSAERSSKRLASSTLTEIRKSLSGGWRSASWSCSRPYSSASPMSVNTKTQVPAAWHPQDCVVHGTACDARAASNSPSVTTRCTRVFTALRPSFCTQADGCEASPPLAPC
jgi:hypothetical protein